MKVIVRQVQEGAVKCVFELDRPLDVQIEIGIQGQVRRFWVLHDEATNLLRIRGEGRLIVQPETANAISLMEVK